MPLAHQNDDAPILASVERFLASRLPPDEVRRRDRDHVPPYDLLPEMGRLGLFALAVPEAEGGLGASWTTIAAVQDAIASKAGAAGSIFNRVVAFGITSLLAHGSAAQRAAHLPGLIAGEAFFALALTEDRAGSDARAVALKATPVAGGFRLDGRKIWVSDADAAAGIVTVARGPGPGEATLFVVPRSSPGLRLTPIPKIGANCMPCFEVVYDGVVVGEDAVLGAVGEGFERLGRTLHIARASLAATATGQAEAALGLMIGHAKERVQFGRPLAANQVVRHRLADLRTRIDLSRLLVRRVADMIDASEPCRREATQAKIVATETLQDVTQAGMQLLASAAYHADSDMQRLWRDARLYTFGEGANDVLRDVVAREMGLGAAIPNRSERS